MMATSSTVSIQMRVQKSDGYLFDEGSKQDYQPNNGKPANADPVQAMVDIFKGDK